MRVSCVLALFLSLSFSLLVCSEGLGLSFPVKAVYIGWENINWANPLQRVTDAVAAGYNLVILTFWAPPNSVNDMMQAWADYPYSINSTIQLAHLWGVPVLMGIWIQEAYNNPYQYVNNATEFGLLAGNLAKSYNLDGVDILMRDFGAGFAAGNMSVSETLDWSVNFTLGARQSLGVDGVITHSPDPTLFDAYVGGGYGILAQRILQDVSLFNLFYLYNTCYTTFAEIFQENDCYGNSVLEISQTFGIPLSKLAVVKPVSDVESPGGGFVDETTFYSYVQQASSIGWNTGVGLWQWNETAFLTQWINAVYPGSLRNLSNPPTPTPTPTPTPAPSLAPITTSSTSTTSSSTSSPTPSPPPSGVDSTCGSGMKLNENKECVCKSGYSKQGGQCKRVDVLVIAIVIPIVAVIIAAVLGFFLWRRYGKAGRYKKERSPSLTEVTKAYYTSNLVANYDELKIEKKLGQGGSGAVYLARWRNTEVAVKEFANQNVQESDFIRESEIHAKLRHPNVVQLLAICLLPHLCTISEFMAKGSLADVLQQKPPQFTWKRKLEALLDIAKGMDYLHKSKIIHRDLKSMNILLDKNWTCKIADFGTSKLITEDSHATVYVPRTAQWSAPEIITQNAYSEKSDVYSFAVIMWECLTGELPFEGMFPYQVEDRTVNGSRLAVPEGCEKWYEDLMKECWDADPNARPNFEAIINILSKEVENIQRK